jgi:hypothetical protein
VILEKSVPWLIRVPQASFLVPLSKGNGKVALENLPILDVFYLLHLIPYLPHQARELVHTYSLPHHPDVSSLFSLLFLTKSKLSIALAVAWPPGW